MSWFSRKVTAREGHQPITPGGLPLESRSLQYSQRCKAQPHHPSSSSDSIVNFDAALSPYFGAQLGLSFLHAFSLVYHP